jgi:hypothetical protein
MHRGAPAVGACDWRRHIARIAADGRYYTAEIGVLTAESSARPQRRPLRAIAYDHHANELELVVGEEGQHSAGALRYFVPAPRAVAVEQSDDETAITVDDASGTRTLIRLHAAQGDPMPTDLLSAVWAAVPHHG